MPVAQFAGKDLREANIRAAEARLTVSQIAAMQVLGRQLALVTGAVTRNTAALMARQQGAGLRGGGLAAPAVLPQRPAPRQPLAGLRTAVMAGGGANPAMMVGSLIGVLGAKIAAVLAPVAILAAAINAEASGFSVFIASMKLLANTVGMFLLPVFLLLSAVALVAANALAQHIDEVEAFAKALFEAGLNAADVLEASANYLAKVIDGMALGFKQATSAVEGFVQGIIEFIRKIPGGSMILSALPALAVGPTAATGRGAAGGVAQGALTPMITGGVQGELKNLEMRRRLGEVRGEKDTSLRQQLLDALKTSLAEFRFQSMPKAQAFGLAQASREAQLRALNQSPFEAKQLELMTKLVEAMGKVVAALGQNRQPPTTS